MSLIRRPMSLLLFAAPLLLVGCASVQRSPGFDEVRTAAAQAGSPHLHWRQGGPADADADAAVQGLLRQELTPDAAVQVALLNNRMLQSSYEGLRIAQADLVEAGLLKNPIFDGSLRFGEGGAGKPDIDFGIAFDFLDVFFIPLRQSIASAEFERAKLDVTGTVIDVAGRTRTTFYALQAAEQTLEARRTTLAAYEASYDLARRIRAAGNTTKLQLVNEQALSEEARLAVVSAEEEVATLREEMNELMGLVGPQASAWKVGPRLPDVPETAFDERDLERRAVEASIDLKLARADVGVAAQRLGITKPLGFLSELEAGAVAERAEGEWSAGPSISLPIPIFTQGQPAVARADAELRQATHAYHATAVEVRSAVRAAYVRMQAARTRALRYRNVVLPLRETILDETQKQYNAMLVGAFELLQAKREQVEAGQRYIESLHDYWIARAKLEQIVSGRLVRGGPTPVGSSVAPSTVKPAGDH